MMPSECGRDVEQKHVGRRGGVDQGRALNGGAHGHDLVGVHALARLAAEEFAHQLLHLAHAGHAADQDHLGQILGLDPGVFHGQPADLNGALGEIEGQLFQLAARDHPVQVEGLIAAGGNDEGQVDFGLAHRREVALGLFGGVLQALQAMVSLRRSTLCSLAKPCTSQSTKRLS
jgi:hypothetical protein